MRTPILTRRACLALFSCGGVALGQNRTTPWKSADSGLEKDWVCPMDPDYRSDKPGVCPRCGMKLVLGVPDRVEYPLEISQSPELLKPGEDASLTLRA
ncbi:MAG TPA: heavy metal-binding domain-containing protein, partial [Bryobacteraceae bacterium]